MYRLGFCYTRLSVPDLGASGYPCPERHNSRGAPKTVLHVGLYINLNESHFIYL